MEKKVDLLLEKNSSESMCLGSINDGSEKCPCLFVIKYFI